MTAARRCVTIAILATLQLQYCAAAAVLGERVSRGTSKSKLDPTVLEYMTQVGAALANNEGIPKDLDSAPTEVWCFPDKGEHACMQLSVD